MTDDSFDDATMRLLEEVRSSPSDHGSVVMIVCRPSVDERTVLRSGMLDVEAGLVGDNWADRPSTRTPDGRAHPGMQLNVINATVSGFLATDPDRRALAGDQLHLDLDLSEANLPPGTRLSIGDAVIEITDQPHLGCAKFSRRFGRDALRLVNSPVGRALRLRGVNARVITGGGIVVGDVVARLG